MREVKHKLNFFIFSQKAETGPPLGTILGNLGVNTLRFTKDFNEFTKDLPEYFKLRVFVSIYEDKTFNFFVEKPTLGYVVSLCQQVDENGNIFLNLDDLIQVVLFYFENLPLEKAIAVVLGSINKNVSIRI